jgi:hypothetical protein
VTGIVEAVAATHLPRARSFNGDSPDEDMVETRESMSMVMACGMTPVVQKSKFSRGPLGQILSFNRSLS